jgi:transposase InsO family protein
LANTFIKAFNGRFRAERWFLSLAAAREKLEDWRKYYNEEHPTGRSAKKRRLCCSTTLAQPARHRDKGGKI